MTEPTGLEGRIRELGRRAREASRALAALAPGEKDAWLRRAGERLESERPRILEANREDLREAGERGVAGPMLKRLDLEGERWRTMLDGLRTVEGLRDPVGEVAESWVRPNGLQVARVRIPLGVVALIYESRPNVTVDAAALCLKAGNAVVLRGGSEALRTNLALADALRAAARDTGLPEDAVGIVRTPDREAIDHLLALEEDVDLAIPRGGAGLIRRVQEKATMPVIKHDAGVCHVFLDASAEPEMAAALVRDSKIRQMSVCNGVETLLVHREAARSVLPGVLKGLHEEGVEIRGCPETAELFSETVPAQEADWSAEYLDRVLAVRVVDGLDAAVAHIQRYGSQHTDVIVTRDYASARAFTRRVDSSTVGVNCSTAYADGYRLGLGAEIGISTSKLHAFGPMGLESLTTLKFVLQGDGQLRE